MEVNLEKEAALVETVLFLESEALDEASLSRITGLGADVVEAALELLVERCSSPDHGLEPVKAGGGWILAPKAELWESLKDRYGKKNENRLSRAALETLSIVAYSQPITRAEVEAIRGVSADGMIRFLLDKALVKEVGKKEAPGRPVQYGTTKEFLKYFRLGSIADLPRLDELERNRFSEESPSLSQREGPGDEEKLELEDAMPAHEAAPNATMRVETAPAEAAPNGDAPSEEATSPSTESSDD
jgi:segregation and condensation protein B